MQPITQRRLWRRAYSNRDRHRLLPSLLPPVREDPLDQLRLLNARNHPQTPAAARALLDLESRAHALLGSQLLDLGLDRQAVEYSLRALEIADSAGIMFWRLHLTANLAIANLRLGRFDGAHALDDALARARGNDERIETSRCLEALAELALAHGDLDRCLGVASELLALAETEDLKELGAQARYLRGAALAAGGDRAAAIEELSIAAAASEKVGRVRLARDVSAALGRVSGDEAAQARAAALDAQMKSSTAGSELESLLRAR